MADHTRWKRAPKPGYVVCPYCFAIVEDKGLKRVAHLASASCQNYLPLPPMPPAASSPQEPDTR